MTLAGRPRDEDRLDGLRGKERCLSRNDLRRQRAVGVKRREDGGDELVERTDRFHSRSQCAARITGGSVSRGLIRSTSTIETSATLAKTLKIPKSGTWRSRSSPKPQSAKPPQLMLTRFMMPY